jgi:hypothetical protein
MLSKSCERRIARTSGRIASTGSAGFRITESIETQRFWSSQYGYLANSVAANAGLSGFPESLLSRHRVAYGS